MKIIVFFEKTIKKHLLSIYYIYLVCTLQKSTLKKGVNEIIGVVSNI